MSAWPRVPIPLPRLIRMSRMSSLSLPLVCRSPRSRTAEALMLPLVLVENDPQAVDLVHDPNLDLPHPVMVHRAP